MKTNVHYIHTLLWILCITTTGIASLSSCSQPKKMVIAQYATRDSINEIATNYGSSIMPGDELIVSIQSQEPESILGLLPIDNTHRKSIEDESFYTIDERETLDLGRIGAFSTHDKTFQTLSSEVQKAIIDSNYVLDPVVTICRKNMRVTLLGMFNHPGIYHSSGERLTILEAIALAGDISYHGVFDSVIVLRNMGKEEILGVIDLTSQDLFNSPYYYLQQNDIVYVLPDKWTQRKYTEDKQLAEDIVSGYRIADALFNIYYRMYIRGHIKRKLY